MNSLRNVKEIFLGIPRNLKIKWEKFAKSYEYSERCQIWSSNFSHNIFRTFPVSHLKILSKTVDLKILWTFEKLSSAYQKMVVVTLRLLALKNTREVIFELSTSFLLKYSVVRVVWCSKLYQKLAWTHVSVKDENLIIAVFFLTFCVIFALIILLNIRKKLLSS